MNLPNREKAYIPLAKLTGYLLSETHPSGQSKAKYLRAAGFDETNVNILEEGLISIAHTQEVQEISSSPHGTKYVLDGQFQAPDSSWMRLRTVWIIDAGQDRPRFVTAYPE